MTNEDRTQLGEYLKLALEGVISDEHLQRIEALTRTREDCLILARKYSSNAFERLMEEAQGMTDISSIERQITMWRGIEIELEDDPDRYTTETLWEWAINQASIDIVRGIK